MATSLKDAPIVHADVIAAHRASSKHRESLLRSTSCGCFHCLAIFPPQLIQEWVDWPRGIPAELRQAHGDTALCPRCGIDSVIGDVSGYPVTTAFLTAMKMHWCAE